jgi:DNA-damage-inducible protein D
MPDDIISFDGSGIRKEWQNNEWHYSAIDIVSVLLDLEGKAAKNYYNVLKSRLRKEGNNTLDVCIRLKLLASDGKRYATDVLTNEQVLRLIQSLPSPKAEPMKLWLARVGKERLDEIADPELGLFRQYERTIEQYRLNGKKDDWIEARVQGIVTRKAFIEALVAAVLNAPPTIFRDATEKLYRGLWERTTAQLRGELQISEKANPRDHFGKYALIYTRLAEDVAKEKLETTETVIMSAALDVVWTVAKLIGKQAKELSHTLGYDLVTEKPLLPKSNRKNKD